VHETGLEALTELRETGRDIPFLKDRPTTLGRVVREISDQVKKRKASG